MCKGKSLREILVTQSWLQKIEIFFLIVDMVVPIMRISIIWQQIAEV